MKRHPRYPYPHSLPISWSAEYVMGVPVVLAKCGSYETAHVIPVKYSSFLVAMVIETLTMEILDYCGTSNLQPVGLMAGASC